MEKHEHEHAPGRRSASSPYLMFALNMLLSLVAMYLVMFSMIDGLPDFRNNLNMLYMALTMVAPMGLLMLATMGGMYASRGINVALYAGLVALFLLAFAATRFQLRVDDRQFIASMVPHHWRHPDVPRGQPGRHGADPSLPGHRDRPAQGDRADERHQGAAGWQDLARRKKGA